MNHPTLAAFPPQRPQEDRRKTASKLQATTNPFVVAIAHALVVTQEEGFFGPKDHTSDAAVDPIVIERLAHVILRSNRDYFRFELHDPIELELVGVSELRGQGHVRGLDPQAPTRKLTSLLLTEINTSDGCATARLGHPSKEVLATSGMAVVAPSFESISLELNPGDTAQALVLHAHGPSFR